jgi:HlyD family secretion protein
VERAKKRADEDLSHFLEIARLQAEKSAQFAVQRAAFSLEYAREELRQLEKMYKSKDLTEDTEKIILKRQQNNVEAAEHFLKSDEVNRDLTLKVTLPRKDKDLREQAVQKELALEKARATLGPSLAQKRQALAKMHNDRDKLLDRLQKLERDRANMVLTAPMDGIVYYGRLYRGQWTGADIMAGRLVPRKIAPADDTLMTVVQARPLMLRVAIEEKDLSFVKPGLQGNAQIASQPGRKLKVRVAKVSSFPSSPGKFEALVNLDPDDSLMPGLACSVNFIPYAKKDALVVAASAVFELDAKYYVTVMAGDGKREIRAVTPGQTFNDCTEILAGLREGEEVLSKGGNP